MIFERFLKIFVLDSVLNVKGFISDERKRCFQTLETMLPMGGNDASDEWKEGRDSCLILDWLTQVITRLQDYTLFFVPWTSKIAYLYYIFILLYIFMYIYTYIYIFINKYT